MREAKVGIAAPWDAKGLALFTSLPLLAGKKAEAERSLKQPGPSAP